MASKEVRIEEVRGLLTGNGVTLGSADTQLQSLNGFRAEVQGDLTTGRLSPHWYAVVNDGHRVVARLGVDREAFVGWVESAVQNA